MATALLTCLSPTADGVGGAALFIWLTIALVFMFSALPRWGMPLVGAIGMVGAIVLALLCAWLTAEGSR